MTGVELDSSKVFDHLFASHHQWVFGFCYRVLQEQDAALDVMVGTWRRVMEAVCAGSTQMSRQELVALAAAECVELLGGGLHDKRPCEHSAEGDSQLLAEVDWDRTEVATLAERFWPDSRVHLVMQRLSPQQRVALVLKYHYGFSTPEVAQVLGCSISAAKAQIRCGMLAAIKSLRSQEGH